MTTQLLTARAWPRITGLAARCKQKCHVAVAYFGQGASKLLPLPAGSTLVVDMSEAAVKGGQTSPAEIGKMLRRGVAVYTCPGLHAKAFVFGKRAIVGSTNVSARSRHVLVEAAMETMDTDTVRSCVNFIVDHCREMVTEEDVKRLEPLYDPGGGGGIRFRKDSKPIGHRPLWAVALSRIDWDEEDTRQADKARSRAKKEMGNPRLFRLEEFCWEGGDFRDRLSETDLVLQVLTEPDKRVLVHPPGKVIRIQQYHVGDSKRMVVFLKEPKKTKAIRLGRLVKRLEAPSKSLKKLKRVRLIKNHKLVYELLGIWRRPTD